MMPDSLQRVEFWRIGWKVEDFHIFAVLREPVPNVFVLVVRGIVLDQIDFAGKVTPQCPFEIVDVGIGIENLLEVIKESSTVKFDGAKYLQGISLSCGRDLWLTASARPRLVERGVLAEAGFVFEEDGRLFAFGFFLRLGYR